MPAGNMRAESERRHGETGIGDRAGRLGVEIADIAGLVTDLSGICQQQAMQADAALEAAAALNATTSRLGRSMGEARQAAGDVRVVLDQSASTISDVVTRTTRAMAALSEGAMTVEATLGNVSGTVAGVERTSAAIAQIARETKLLALNA